MIKISKFLKIVIFWLFWKNKYQIKNDIILLLTDLSNITSILKTQLYWFELGWGWVGFELGFIKGVGIEQKPRPPPWFFFLKIH